MEFLNVLAAGIASYGFGAVWYIILAKPWASAADIDIGDDGKPVNNSAAPFIIAFICSLLVAGMMRHVFAASGIEAVSAGIVSGAGIGLFLSAPWLITCYAFGNRPITLMLIDSGYAIIGSAIMGAVLTLF